MTRTPDRSRGSRRSRTHSRLALSRGIALLAWCAVWIGPRAHAQEMEVAALERAGLPIGTPLSMRFAEDVALLGTDEGLYRLEASRASWEPLLPGVEVIDLASRGGATLIVGDGDLFTWTRGSAVPSRAPAPPGIEVTSVAVDALGRGWAASSAGLLLRPVGAAEFSPAPTAPRDVAHVRAAGADVWAAVPGSLWLQRDGAPFERKLAGLSDGWWELQGAVRAGEITWLAVPRGLWRIAAGSAERRALSGTVVGLESRGTTLAVATTLGLSCFGVAADGPSGLTHALQDAVALASAPGSGLVLLAPAGARALGCDPVAPSRGTALAQAAAAAPASPLPAAVELPDPAQVTALHRAVLAHLDLEPGRMRAVEQRARRLGRLPEIQLSMGADLERTKDVGRDQTFTGGRLQDLLDGGRSRQGFGEIKLLMKWDLERGVEPDAAIAISRERRELVELRDQILERVNRIYFELTRTRAKLAAASPGPERSELQIRVRELTAALDAWSGGRFSNRNAPEVDP